MTSTGETPPGSQQLARSRATISALIDPNHVDDPDRRLLRLTEAIETLVELDPDPALAVAASDVAMRLATYTSDRGARVSAARASHLARCASGDADGAALALERLREAAETDGDVDGVYDATWFEFLTAVQCADGFGVRRGLGALRSFATAGSSHRAVSLHRSARCLAEAIGADAEPIDAWPDGTPYDDDHVLRPALAPWSAIGRGRPEDARFALDRSLETGALERVPASMRPAALVITGRACAALDAPAHATSILAALETHRGSFIATGPRPVRWLGPVDLVLGELAASLGDRTTASAHLDAARSACERLRATSMTPRLRRLAETIDSADFGDSDARRSKEPRSSSTHRRVSIERVGSMWRFRRGDIDATIAHRKGLGQLRSLLADPGREYHCVDLVQPGAARQSGVDLLDERARNAYRARYEELTATIAEAAEWNDDEREFRAREELSALADELGRGIGLGGRTRTTGSTVERARVNATRTIRGAISMIAELDPVFGTHLDRCVRTGIYCVYESDGSYDIGC